MATLKKAYRLEFTHDTIGEIVPCEPDHSHAMSWVVAKETLLQHHIEQVGYYYHAMHRLLNTTEKEIRLLHGLTE